MSTCDFIIKGYYARIIFIYKCLENLYDCIMMKRICIASISVIQCSYFDKKIYEEINMNLLI